MRTEGLAFRPLGTQTVQAVAARPNTLWSIPWEHRGSARHENRLTCDIILKGCPSARTRPLGEQTVAEATASRSWREGREGDNELQSPPCLWPWIPEQQAQFKTTEGANEKQVLQ